MKYGIELNGVANLKLLINELESEWVHKQNDTSDSIQEQLDLLERYMIAFCDAINGNTEPPKWHEVRENPKQYKTNRERF